MSSHPSRHARAYVAVLAVLGVLVLASGSAEAASVTNGSFESGDFTGWTTDNQDANVWSVYTGTDISGETVPAPACGTFAAGSHNGDIGSAVLYQDLALEPAQTHQLSLRYWYQTNGPFVTPDSLDDTVAPNNQYRIDLMDPAADPYSAAASDILQPLFRTDVGDPMTSGWVQVDVDISALAGQTVRLRMGVATTNASIAGGVDCVQVASQPVATTTTSTTSTTAPLRGCSPAYQGGTVVQNSSGVDLASTNCVPDGFGRNDVVCEGSNGLVVIRGPVTLPNPADDPYGLDNATSVGDGVGCEVAADAISTSPTFTG